MSAKDSPGFPPEEPGALARARAQLLELRRVLDDHQQCLQRLQTELRSFRPEDGPTPPWNALTKAQQREWLALEREWNEIDALLTASARRPARRSRRAFV